MNSADFDTQFDRLVGAFHLPTDSTREKVAMDWFQALQGYELAVVERSVTTMIRAAQDRYWPPLGTLLNHCRGRAAGSPTGKCATCHGSTWIESAPFKSNGMIYAGAVIRCPDCSVPAPQYSAPSRRDSLTAIEYREWSEGSSPRDYMPEECKAKPWKSDADRLSHKAEMLAAFEKLRIRLFGKDAA